MILQKKDWVEEHIQTLFSEGREALSLKLDEHNSEYYQYTGVLSKLLDLNAWKVNITFPAAKYHIDKFRPASFVVVRETPGMYKSATLKYIESIPEKHTDWVRGILNGTKEADRVVISDSDSKTGFVMVPDFKFDQKDMTSAYFQCLVRDSSIKSVRDLNAEHLPLLKNIREKVLKAVLENYEIPKTQVRLYVHYYPTFWLFHVHVVHAQCMTVGQGANVGRAILLDDIIQMIEVKSNYFAEATLTAQVKVGLPHHQLLLQEDPSFDK